MGVSGAKWGISSCLLKIYIILTACAARARTERFHELLESPEFCSEPKNAKKNAFSVSVFCVHADFIRYFQVKGSQITLFSRSHSVLIGPVADIDEEK